MAQSLKKSKSFPDGHTPGKSSAALALEAVGDGFWDWDLLKGRIYLSPQWKLLARCGALRLHDNPEEWFSGIHHDDISIVKDRLRAHLEEKIPYFSSEHRLQHDDSCYRWVLARGTVFRNGKGIAARFVGTLTDIDEHKRDELKLKAQFDEMRFALASEKVLMEELDRKNRELLELSITDGLTGLYNHRHLLERIDFEFKRIRRYGGHLSCLLIDIDHFKMINDNCGHQFGDYVIKEVAAIIIRNSREVDICGRYGGEEFVVLSNVDVRHALFFAKRLHKAIEHHLFEHRENKIKVTVSIGIAGYNTKVKTKQELIERSDRAMYQAKKEGRNRIRLWNEKAVVAASPIKNTRKVG